MGESRSGQHRQVVHQVAMRLASAPDPATPVTAELCYSTRDPFAVRATFTRAAHSPVVWVFGRELLMGGTSQSVGTGDVRVYPAGGDVILELTSPEGSARLAADGRDIRRFTDQALNLVAPGGELDYIDIDAELAQLDPATFTGGE